MRLLKGLVSGVFINFVKMVVDAFGRCSTIFVNFIIASVKYSPAWKGHLSLVLIVPLPAKQHTSNYDVWKSASNNYNCKNYCGSCVHFQQHERNHAQVNPFADGAIKKQKILEQFTLENLKLSENEQHRERRNYKDSSEHKIECYWNFYYY